MSERNDHPDSLGPRTTPTSDDSTIGQTTSFETRLRARVCWSILREEDTRAHQIQRQHNRVPRFGIFPRRLGIVAATWTAVLHWRDFYSTLIESMCGLNHWNHSRSYRRTRVHLLLFCQEDIGRRCIRARHSFLECSVASQKGPEENEDRSARVQHQARSEQH